MEIKKVCKWCSEPFVAQKITTMYCCHTCNSRAYKAQKKLQQIDEYMENEAKQPLQVAGVIGNKPFLTPVEVSTLLRVSLATVYRYMATGVLKALRIRARTRIRMADVEQMFSEDTGYKKRSYRRKESILYYSTNGILEKYKITKKTLYKRCERFGIEKIIENRKVYYNKASIDTYFAELIEEFNRADYYTPTQIMEKYGMTQNAVRAYVMRHNIPRIKRHQDVFYNKAAIDAIKEKSTKTDSHFYTYEEIKLKYGFTTINISYYVNKYDIKRYKQGSRTMVSREEFDRTIRERKEGVKNRNTTLPKEENGTPQPTIPDGYLSAEQIAEKYRLSRSSVWKLTRENNIASISIKGIKYYATPNVEAFFAKFESNEEVSVWITPKQMEEMYGMTPDARRSFAHRHHIPTKLVYGNIEYSKDHIDKVKNSGFDNRENYYTVAEAMERYNLRRDEVYNYIRYNKLQKLRKGQMVFLLKADFDRVINEKLSEL
ncbi:MAG: helix-turn-helix domain-containing protein [Phocaeicola sp.]